MSGPTGGGDDRQRTLRAASRFAETPRVLTVEWTADARDYVVVPPPPDEADAGRAVLWGVFEDARHKMTRLDVLQNWPQDHPKPHPATLVRWLDDAVAAGTVTRSGSGRKRDPFRYWLPGREGAFGYGLSEIPELADLPHDERMAYLRLAGTVLKGGIR